MTQQWGPPGQPGAGATWNQPPQAWGAPGTSYQQAGYPAPGGFPSQPGSAGYPPPGGFQPTNPGGPRRRGPLRSLLLGLLMMVGLVLFAVSMLNFLAGGSEDTQSAAPPPPSTAPTAAPSDGTEPTGGADPSSSASGVVSVPKPDFNPPDIPQPETYSQATKWLTSNPVYAKAVTKPTNCAVPEINLAAASVSELTTHLNDLTACLWQVWEPPLDSAGYALPRPPVTVYTQPITTGCGSLDDVNAVYCAADQRIYYAKPLYRIFPADQQRARFVVETVLAHEFGHTIQARTGILVSSMAWEQRSSEADAKVFSRRLEVQADCLSGMFSSAVAASSGLSEAELKNLADVMYSLGDDVLTGQANYNGDHGLGRSRKAWLATGQSNSDIGKCNTFVAPASSVR